MSLIEDSEDAKTSVQQKTTATPDHPATTLKDFLENTPPDMYVYLIDLEPSRSNQHYFSSTEILRHCENDACLGPRMFRTTNEIPSSFTWQHTFLTYVCRNCGTGFVRFAIASLRHRDANVPGPMIATAIKYGQIPTFGPPTSARLMTLIGPDRDIFLQGRRAENRGMGIGAFAYYRRVVENQKDRILQQIARVAKILGSTPATDKLFAAAINETQFSKSIGMVKDALPDTLLISGRNPLTLLHSALSKGLHNPDMTDAHCLALAQSIRIVLGELSERTSEALKNDKEIQNALSVLLSISTPSQAVNPFTANPSKTNPHEA